MREDDGQVVTIEVASIPMLRDGAPAMLSVARDVTSRKRRSETPPAPCPTPTIERRKLEAILAAPPVGVWIVAAAGAIVQRNAAAERTWYGSMPPELRHREYKAFSADTGRPLTGDAWPLARTLKGGDVVVAEPVIIERFDGMRAHLIASTAPIKDDDGQIIGAVAVCLDVTERHEAERERERLVLSLEFERSRLGALLQKAPAFIAILRGDDLILEIVNDAFYDIVGQRPLIGEPMSVGLSETKTQGLVAIAKEVLATGEPFSARGLPVLLARRPNAPMETRFANVVCQPIVEADGRRSGVFAHGVDITDETTAQRRVKAQFNGLPVPTYAWQAIQGDPTGDLVLVDCNDTGRGHRPPRRPDDPTPRRISCARGQKTATKPSS